MDAIEIYFESWWKNIGHKIGHDGTARKEIALAAWKEGVNYATAAQETSDVDSRTTGKKEGLKP